MLSLVSNHMPNPVPQGWVVDVPDASWTRRGRGVTLEVYHGSVVGFQLTGYWWACLLVSKTLQGPYDSLADACEAAERAYCGCRVREEGAGIPVQRCHREDGRDARRNGYGEDEGA